MAETVQKKETAAAAGFTRPLRLTMTEDLRGFIAARVGLFDVVFDHLCFGGGGLFDLFLRDQRGGSVFVQGRFFRVYGAGDRVF